VEVVLVVALLGFLLAVAEPGQVGAATPAGGPGAVLVVAVLGLCGFGATLAPCAPGVTPLRAPPPRPMLVSFLLDPRTVVVTAGLLLAGVAWSVGGGAASAGPDTATGPIAGPETILHVLDADVGPSLARVVGFVAVGSLLAAALAAHRAGTGHLFVLGHQRLLPAPLARTSRRSASPMVASGVQSLLTGAVIAVAATAGLDPYRHLFVSVGFAGAFGVLVLVTVTVWAVLADAARRRAVRAVTVVAAVAASLALAGAAFGSYLTFGLSDPYGVTLLAMYPLAAVVGLTWAALLRGRQPAPLDLERR
jgi:amino acid transporter